MRDPGIRGPSLDRMNARDATGGHAAAATAESEEITRAAGTLRPIRPALVEPSQTGMVIKANRRHW